MTMIPNATASTQMAKHMTAPVRPAADGLVISSPAGPTLTRWRLLLRERTPSANSAGSPTPNTRPTNKTCQSASKALVKISMIFPLLSARGLGWLAFVGWHQPAVPFGVDVLRRDRGTPGPEEHVGGTGNQDAEDDGDTEGAADGVG